MTSSMEDSTHSIGILLVEDNPGDARLVQAALAEHAPREFAVTWVERLADALVRIASEHFDVVLCDLGLPDSSGLATVQAIAGRSPALPLVVLTGSHDEDLGREAIQRGAQDYLVKGESGGTLIARTLRYAIERKRFDIGLRAANEALERRVTERTGELETLNQSLRASETRYRALFDNMRDGFAYCKMQYDDRGRAVDFTYLVVNDAFGRLTGLKDVVGKPVTEVIPRIREMNPDLFEIYGRVASTGVSETFEIDFKPLSKWLTVTAYGFERGCFAATFDDITERKRAEMALARESHRNQVFLRNASDGVHIFDAEGNVLEVSDSFCQMLGYSRGELIGANVSLWDAQWSPQELKQLIAAQIAKGVRSEFRTRHRRRDGGVFNVEISGQGLELDGKPVLFNSARDITERISAEQQLVEAEARFRGLVEQSIAGIYIIQDGKLIYVNPRFAELFGYDSADEPIGHDALSVIAENERAAVEANIRNWLKGGTRSISYSSTALRKAGSTIEVGVHATRATYHGRPAIIGMVQDISEKKRAEERIQRYVAQLENAFMSTVQVAMTLSGLRDPYTAGHERRVAEIAVAIGAELGFDARRLEGLRVAGYLHDVGKITVPSEILVKPGKLSAIEFELIKGHPRAGYDVLKDVEFPWPVADVAMQHHERMDGSGYPQGLKGEAILLEARIMAVADVVEAHSSHRPYRAGLGIEKALAEIERGRGTAYDASVADACLQLFREKSYSIPI